MKKSITSQKQIVYLFNALCGVMVFLLTLSVNSIYVSAEGSNSLPYVVEDNLIEDWSFYRTNYEEIAHAWGYPQSFIDDLNWDSDEIIVRSVLTDGRVAYTYVFVPRVSVSSSYSVSLSQTYNNFDSSVDYVTIRFTGYEVLQFNTNSSLVTNFYGYATSGMSVVSFLGSYPEPVFLTGDFIDSNNNIIFTLPSDPLPDIRGHATPPINDHGHYIPNPHPNKPSPTPYNPPTPQFPSIDTSTLEKLVESLIDVVEYGFSYIGNVVSGWFSNLISNVSDYLDYIGDLLVAGFNNVVGSIQDFATDFYNNMVSLIEPIFDFFSGVSNFFNSLIELGMVDGQFSFGTFISKLVVPDVSDVVDLLTDNDAFGSHGLFLASYHKIQFLINTFNNLQPIKVFTVPSTTWHGYTLGGFTIDFSWYDNFKVYMDLILSGFLIIGYLYWLFSSLNSLFRGTGSMVYDSLYETPTKGGEHH